MYATLELDGCVSFNRHKWRLLLHVSAEFTRYDATVESVWNYATAQSARNAAKRTAKRLGIEIVRFG